MKKIIIAILTLIFISGCTIDTGKVDIAATFYPLYDLTKSIIGDSGTVYSVVPSGVEPHDYEPSPGDIRKLNSADAYVIMGIEFAEFEEDLIEAEQITTIDASYGIPLLQIEEDEHEEEKEDEHSGNDPHIWLSPNNVKLMTNNIASGLKFVFPENADIYTTNTNSLINKLDILDNEFKVGLSSCNKDIILVNHNAFSYLARDYGFRTIEIHGLEPETEPTPGQLAELIEEAKENNIKYIFYEELVDPRIANTIANEVGAQVLELSPIEGTTDLSQDYFSLMRKNLANLKVALECQS